MNEQLQQQKRRLLLVKYGGSAVTIKDRLETLHPEALHSCADHVSELLRTNAALGPDDYRTDIVIVHGAGTVPTLPNSIRAHDHPFHGIVVHRSPLCMDHDDLLHTQARSVISMPSSMD
jgi:hypothetical protein